MKTDNQVEILVQKMMMYWTGTNGSDKSKAIPASQDDGKRPRRIVRRRIVATRRQ